MVSIQVQNSSVVLGRTDINIRCLVNNSDIERIGIIQLLGSYKNIVSITEKGVSWQDENLHQRAADNGSFFNDTYSYLHISIESQRVTKNDGGTYFCTSTVRYRNIGTVFEETEKVYLNITGNQLKFHLK